MGGKAGGKLKVYRIPYPKTLVAATLVLASFLMLFLSGTFSYFDRSSGVFHGTSIAIDPGHGGIDGGVGRHEILEKDINLEVAKILRSKLRAKGARVVMTRKKDEELSYKEPDLPGSRHRRDLSARVNMINQSEVDLFVSLHLNACEASYVRGAICFYQPDFEDSVRLAECIQNELNLVTGKELQEGELLHRSTKEGPFFLLLNTTDPPGVIVEMGFISNPTDRELLAREDYRKELAEAIKRGIVEYLQGTPPTESFNRLKVKVP